MQKGYLFLIGGAEDRKKDKHVLKHLVEQTRPTHILIIPTASAYPQDVFRSYADAFRDLEVDNVDYLDIRYRDEADREDYLAAVEQTDLIFFGGGDQVKLVDVLHHTHLFNRIRARFESGNLHIAGTSAGAAAAGNPILYNGDRRGYKKGSIKFAEGFGLIDGIAIDTHFSARRRFARLCQLLISGHCRKGIGLDEDTGIMVYPNMHFKVIGSGMVTIINSAHATGSNYHAVAKADMLRFNNMHVGCLPAGTLFSLKKWSILNRVRQPKS
jgi:cyanophycinase